MSFAWPLALVSVLVVPLIVGVYWWLLRRRRRQAVRYSSVALLRSVIPRRKRWQRHLPIALVLASLLALGLAAARPHVVRDVPYARTSIILALDVSGSMCSTDVKPNRLVVAQEASRAFVEDQPDEVRMGLVVFSGFAELAVPPTTERSELMSTIDTVTTGRGTAIGGAMLKGLDAIAEVNPAVQPVGDVFALDDTPSRRVRRRAASLRGLRGGHHRAPHRRPEHAGNRAARRGAPRDRAAGARLHDRVRDHRARRALVHTRTARGPGLRRRVRRWGRLREGSEAPASRTHRP